MTGFLAEADPDEQHKQLADHGCFPGLTTSCPLLSLGTAAAAAAPAYASGNHNGHTTGIDARYLWRCTPLMQASQDLYAAIQPRATF